LTGDKSAYDYLGASIDTFPDRDQVAGEIRAAGFNHITHQAMTFGIVALHVAKA
jgi:demethylmenaquinone methyltransferase/2-methoxy-6-polyprenyl-1,4-benzoquinol methylase